MPEEKTDANAEAEEKLTLEQELAKAENEVTEEYRAPYILQV